MIFCWRARSSSCSNFSPEERKELSRLLGKLVDNLEQYPV